MSRENFVVAEMAQGEHDNYPRRCWAVAAPTRIAALREIAALYPEHGPLKIVDGPGECRFGRGE